jgi:purine-cytosine permease-like protein
MAERPPGSGLYVVRCRERQEVKYLIIVAVILVFVVVTALFGFKIGIAVSIAMAWILARMFLY